MHIKEIYLHNVYFLPEVFHIKRFIFQIGYEPLPPRPTKTLLGRPALALPNVFGYSKCVRL